MEEAGEAPGFAAAVGLAVFPEEGAAMAKTKEGVRSGV